jgi:hypothetical protein
MGATASGACEKPGLSDGGCADQSAAIEDQPDPGFGAEDPAVIRCGLVRHSADGGDVVSDAASRTELLLDDFRIAHFPAALLGAPPFIPRVPGRIATSPIADALTTDGARIAELTTFLGLMHVWKE